MEPILSVNNPPDVSAEQRASIELLMRIRKLRWIGEEDEALRRESSSAALNRGETMDKVNTLGAGIALAVTLALISALCAIAFVLAPDATLDFFSAFMHGLDLKAVKSAAPISFGRVLYGLIGLSIVGFIAGVVFAWMYNAISRQ
jgi:2TM family of unknown function (DUF5676)